MKLYKPHEVRTVKCTKCKELLLKLYPWAFVNSTAQEIKVMCGRCSNKVIKNAKTTTWKVKSPRKISSKTDPLEKYHKTIAVAKKRKLKTK